MESQRPEDDISKVIRLIMTSKTLKYGAIAGFIATWSISTAIAASEIEMGLPISTFYAVMGISFGLTDPITASYLGFGLHLITGTILGGVIAMLAVRIEKLRKSNMSNILNPYRAILMGIGTGMLVWLALFLPVTVIFVQPSEDRISRILSTDQERSELGGLVGDVSDISQSFIGIAISAIVFHVIWGAIFGFIINSLLRIRLFILSNPTQTQHHRPLGRIVLFGIAAGLISSIAISGVILLVEKTSALPVGTFYYVLVSALTNSYSDNFAGTVAIGLSMHLATGSVMGLLMSVPFMILNTDRSASQGRGTAFVLKSSPAYGLVFGFALWLLVFIPSTYMLILPLLSSFENQDVLITQRVPTGEISSATFFRLVSMADQIIFGALAFNMFYGLLVGIIIQSFYERHLRVRNVRQEDVPRLLPDSSAKSIE